MRDKIKILVLFMAISFGFNTFVGGIQAISKTAEKAPITIQKQAITTQPHVYIPANSLDIVVNPTKYLNKRVHIKAKFDKFSALGLDYKPAFRSSENFITLLIRRDDVITHSVPLSEMKLFMKRADAEKFIDLESGDAIEIDGLVFSDALSDAWVEVENFTVVNPKPKKESSTKK